MIQHRLFKLYENGLSDKINNQITDKTVLTDLL